MFERELNNYWKTVVDTIQEGVMLVDTTGNIISTNKALQDMTGYSREELVGASCRILDCDLCAQMKSDGEPYWCHLFATGRIQIRECAIKQKNGQYLPVLKNGAVLKDGHGEVIGAVETLTDISDLLDKEQQIESYKKALAADDSFHGLVGSSAPMRSQFDLISNAAHSEAPVIIFGESGTGKELAAGAIHAISARRNKPLIKVNCAALSDSLLESELFGHVKGAFTGATANRKGRFEAAAGGSIFLDEIGDLPLGTQVKLLRVLEEKVVERVGDNKPVAVNVRVISATNKNLDALVQAGHFREDLYFRINVIPIHLPPLRERKEDIPALAEMFFAKMKLKSEKNIPGISTEAMQALNAYHWPGNVRELKSVFEYAFVSCQEGIIKPEHLLPSVLGADRTPPLRQQTDQGRGPKADEQRETLIRILQETRGNQSQTARRLGVSRVTVWNWIKKYGISVKNTIEG